MIWYGWNDAGNWGPYQHRLIGDETTGATHCIHGNNLVPNQDPLLNIIKTKRRYYFWICGSNFAHEIKENPTKKAGHKDEVYYKKILGGIEKAYEWRLGVIMDKIKIR